MKKLLAFLICVTLVLSLFGCKKVEENVRGTISYSDDEEIEGKKVTEKEYNKKTDKEEKKSKKFSLGTTSGTTYTNEFIGIGCKLDKGWTFKSEEEKSKYIALLDTELSVINSMDMGIKAQAVYNLKYDKPNHVISKRCIDFKAMERLAIQYNK